MDRGFSGPEFERGDPKFPLTAVGKVLTSGFQSPILYRTSESKVDRIDRRCPISDRELIGSKVPKWFGGRP